MHMSLALQLASWALCGLVTAESTLRRSSGVTAASTATPTTREPCAPVSSFIASVLSADPSYNNGFPFRAEVAMKCALSAPIVKKDAVRLLDGLHALLAWQSDLAYLKSPPDGYLLEGVDLLGGIMKLRSMVQAGQFTSEIEFESELVALIGKAHDGHLSFVADGLNVFSYTRGNLGSLVSISSDGLQLPQIWSYNDLVLSRNQSLSWTPSPVATINGLNATDFLIRAALNTTIQYQDPDALYNSLFFELAGDGAPGQFASPFNFANYIGDYTDLTFANGTSQSYLNEGITGASFTGVDDGKSFYNNFCNAQHKMNQAGGSGSKAKRQTSASSAVPPTATNIEHPRIYYPDPVYVATDGSLAGYFLSNAGFEQTAVLSLLEVSENAEISNQKTLKKFLQSCKENGKTNLVIDMSQNTGGSIMLGYDIFKQLFPNVAPYGAANFRAMPQYDILGQAITRYASSIKESKPNNDAAFTTADGYTIFDAMTWDNQYGVGFQSWDDYYGPETRHSDNFTRVVRWNISNPLFDKGFSAGGKLVVSYTQGGQAPQPPFQPENIVLFSDGQCSSTCHTISHFLKWQGKVKSIVAGGRPQTGPMNYVGGTKGKNVYPLNGFQDPLYGLYTVAPKSVIEQANQTGLKTLADDGTYIAYRTSNPLEGSSVGVNIQNSLAEGDDTFTPLQFVYEAADCRIWYTEDMIFDITKQWTAAAGQAFGLNGTIIYGLCVEGSTGHPSSLSGNPVLWNNGVPNNVTDFVHEKGVPTKTAAGGASQTTKARRWEA